MMRLDEKGRLKIAAAIMGAVLGLSGAAIAAATSVTSEKLFVSGSTVTPPADNIAPTVVSITRNGDPATNATSVGFTVTFSEAVTGVDGTDFALTSTVTGATVSGVSTDTGSTRTVTVSTGTGSGTIRLDLVDNDSIIDAASNPLGGTGAGNGSFTAGESYTIDKAAPTVVSIARVGSSPTNAASVEFTVTFSETVAGVGVADFGFATTGTISGAGISNVSADSGNTRTVTVNTGTGSGTIRLDVTDDDSIIDAARNPLGGTGTGNGNFAAGEIFTIDKTAPTAVISFPVAGAFYNTAGYEAGCSTPGGDFCGTAADVGSSVTNVKVSLQRGTGNFWNGTGFSNSTAVLLDAIGAGSWSFSFAGTSFGIDGSYTLRAVPTDAAGNTGTVGSTFTIDNTAPTATDVQTANVGATAGRAEQGDTTTFFFSEQMNPASIIAGWDGTTSRNVVVRILNGTGQGNDTLEIYDATNVTPIPLGSIDLGGKNYNTEKGNTAVTFGATGTASTMTMSGSQIIIRLGTASSTNVGTGTNGTMIWTPSTGPTDRAGNPLSTTAVNETGTADVEF